ncbi:glycosyltransferase [Pontibacter sp. E15-1]|uniref:CgeB family protein n=1 Tax=Pontibacter sp. E15-1 TaxID=2919918 RepID=UPI001F4FD499|nr:glycosyltransferase [Pontibacter sp. E15-1]MCJ8164472.1 glycosyltransferase [Pontibacter sp. E15-1]
MNIVILGLSNTSGRGDGHTALYQPLMRELSQKGHHILFLKRERPGYGVVDESLNTGFCETGHYYSLKDLQLFTEQVHEADMVILGSSVPEGVQVAEWVLRNARGVKAFYDLDTPVTLARLNSRACDYLNPDLIPQFDLYLSVMGGPALEVLERQYGSPMARALYRSVDATLFYPEFREKIWDLGYLADFTESHQPLVDKLMLEAASDWSKGRFVVAGAQYPPDMPWPTNTKYTQQLQTADHRKFYNSLRFALHITGPEALPGTYAPSASLLEAAACGTPIIANYWEGLEDVLAIDSEILVSRSSKETIQYLREISKSERKLIGERARKKILSRHTPARRAKELIGYAEEFLTLDGEPGAYNLEVVV